MGSKQFARVTAKVDVQTLAKLRSASRDSRRAMAVEAGVLIAEALAFRARMKVVQVEADGGDERQRIKDAVRQAQLKALAASGVEALPALGSGAKHVRAEIVRE